MFSCFLPKLPKKNLIQICMDKITIKEEFLAAVDKNIMVYDRDSHSFSLRLIALAKTISRRENFGNLLGVYLSLPEEINIMGEKHTIADGTFVLGVPVVVCDVCFETELKNADGSTYNGKPCVCLFISEYGSFLGCY